MEKYYLFCIISISISGYIHQILGQSPPKYDHGIGVPTTRPLNIGHRGSAGTIPENTVASFEQSVLDGADMIECDIYVTKDRQLVCLHEPNLGTLTDIATRPEFGEDRKSTYDIPETGEVTDWFCFDFTLEELKTLRVLQPADYRDQSVSGRYPISTFDEHVAVAKNADRVVGIYPEPKFPAWINSLDFMNGTKVEDLLLEKLESHGYNGPDDACIVQCFEEETLKYIKERSQLPLAIMVWLDEHYLGPYLNDSKIAEWSTMFYAMGAWKVQVVNYYNTVNSGYKNWINGSTGLLEEVKNAGLKFHLYTFRNEDEFLAYDFHQDPVEEYQYFMQMGIDGYFTDFPKTFDRVLDAAYREQKVDCVGGAVGPKPALAGLLVWIVWYLGQVISGQ